jgi:hypothetical protein
VARTILSEVKGTPNYIVMSNIQKNAVRDALQRSKMDATTASEVATALTNVEWADGDLNHLLGHLQAVGQPKAVVRRRGSQDYCNIHFYGDQQLWHALQDADTTAASKLDIIMSIAVGLGCRLPSESTMKLMCSWWLVVTQPHPTRLERAEKQVHLWSVKKAWEKLKRARSDPEVWLESVPPSPAQLLTEHPDIYKRWFKDASPVMPPTVFLKTLAEVEMSYGCRGGTVKKTTSTDVASGVERMLALAIQSLAGGPQVQCGAASGEIPLQFTKPRPKCLHDLASPAVVRQPTTSWDSPLLAIMNGSQTDSQVDSPPAASRPQQSQAIAPCTDTPPAAGNSDHVATLMAMLDAREAAKKSAKGGAKKRPAAAPVDKDNGHEGEADAEHPESGGEGDEDELEVGDAAATAKGAAGKNKAKKSKVKATDHSGSKAKAKGKGCATTGKGEAIAEAASPPTDAHRGSEAASSTAKGCGKGKNDGKRRKTGEKGDGETPGEGKPADGTLILGCGKCRGSHVGCAQCRSPTFGGVRWQR